jgi:SAM-dependent methyltransferase
VRYEWLVEHHATEASYWWFRNKRRLVYQWLARHAPPGGDLLEVGSGGGFLSAALQARGWRVTSADCWPAAAAFARERGVPRALAFDAGVPWPLRDASYDVIVMLDVVEHLPDDALVMKELRRVLRPGGYAVVSVPAYPWLFSAWDTYNQHYRRYTASSLRKAARGARLSVREAGYWNLISLPPAIILRLRDRWRGVTLEHAEYPLVSRPVERLLVAWGWLEAAWLRWLPLPAGLSAYAILHRDEEDR